MQFSTLSRETRGTISALETQRPTPNQNKTQRIAAILTSLDATSFTGGHNLDEAFSQRLPGRQFKCRP